MGGIKVFATYIDDIFLIDIHEASISAKQAYLY